MYIINGKKIKDKKLSKIKKEISSLSFRPIFCDVLVGSDRASLQYVNMKKRNAKTIGIDFHSANFKSSISIDNLIEKIRKLNEIQNMCGIIVQLPLPKALNQKKVLDAINPKLDVDCLGKFATGNFYKGNTDFGFPTALACMELLDSTGVSLKNKKIIVLGQGKLVGRPVSFLLKKRGYSVINLNSRSSNKKEIIKRADVIISGIGKGKYIKGDMIKKGVILIDAGTSESGSGIVGDIDFESVKNVAGFLSPVPGGVGPVTIAMLFNNVLKVAKSKNE